MAVSTNAVILALIINRISVIFFTQCRCILSITPFSSSLFFGLAVVTILARHPELYPCWMRKPSCNILFMYYFLLSLAVIEVAFCLWNSLETFLFFTLPSKLEFSDCCGLYLDLAESPLLVGVISNLSSLTLLLITLHITKVCNFNLLLCENGWKSFINDIAESRNWSQTKCPKGHICPPKSTSTGSPRVTRSGRQFGC